MSGFNGLRYDFFVIDEHDALMDDRPEVEARSLEDRQGAVRYFELQARPSIDDEDYKALVNWYGRYKQALEQSLRNQLLLLLCGK